MGQWVPSDFLTAIDKYDPDLKKVKSQSIYIDFERDLVSVDHKVVSPNSTYAKVLIPSPDMVTILTSIGEMLAFTAVQFISVVDNVVDGAIIGNSIGDMIEHGVNLQDLVNVALVGGGKVLEGLGSLRAADVASNPVEDLSGLEGAEGADESLGTEKIPSSIGEAKSLGTNEVSEAAVSKTETPQVSKEQSSIGAGAIEDLGAEKVPSSIGEAKSLGTNEVPEVAVSKIETPQISKEQSSVGEAGEGDSVLSIAGQTTDEGSEAGDIPYNHEWIMLQDGSTAFRSADGSVIRKASYMDDAGNIK